MRFHSALLLTLLSYAGFSQILDTSGAHDYKPFEVYRYSEYGLDFLEVDSQALDTQLLGFYNYYQPYDESYPFLDHGFEGSPVLKLGKGPQENRHLSMGTEALEAYFYSDTIFSHHTKDPFTRLNYSQGAPELIYIEAHHAQQISKRLTFGIDYRRIKNQNLYYSNLLGGETQRFANLFNTKFYTGFNSKDRRYEFLFSYLWNKSTNIETGGIRDPEFYNSLDGRSKENNNAVNLPSASNLDAVNSFRLVQYYRFAKEPLDSSNPQDLNRFRGQFILKSQYFSKRLEYWDDFPDSAYYGLRFPALHDSIQHRFLSNELDLMLQLSSLDLIAGIEHRYDYVYINGFPYSFNSVYVKGKTVLAIKDFDLFAEAQTGVLGYNLGDYVLEGELSYRNKLFNLEAGIHSSLTEPTFLAQRLSSYPRTWDNDFAKTSINRLYGEGGIRMGLHQFNLHFRLSNIANYIYYTADGQVNQYTPSFQYVNAGLGYAFKWKPLSLEVNIDNQQSTAIQVFPRPEWSATGKLYSTFSLFQNNLIIQTGLEGFWFSDFNAPLYLPYLRQWGVQDTSFSSYPPIQFFLNAKVLSFNFGIVFFNVQEGLMGNDFYSAPLYPMMPRMLRFNIRWDLRS